MRRSVGERNTVVRRKRSQVIVEDYLRQITSGGIQEGALLPTENALIEHYGVSRTAVREAVQALAAKGFVEIRQGSGTTVLPSSRWNVLDPDYLQVTGFQGELGDNLLETRNIFEPAIAGLAALRATDEEIVSLRARASALTSVRHGDRGGHADADIRFHHALAEATGNPVLISLHASITHVSRLQRELMAGDEAAIERAIFWHQHIVDAVASRDSGGAEDAMRMHLRQVRTDLTSVKTGPSSDKPLLMVAPRP